jgi:magnesium transporter
MKPISHSHSTTNDHSHTFLSAMGGLQGERLHQMVVFELREDGNTQYSTMTLRSLYNHVVKTITQGCRDAEQQRRSSGRASTSTAKDESGVEVSATRIHPTFVGTSSGTSGSTTSQGTPVLSNTTSPQYEPLTSSIATPTFTDSSNSTSAAAAAADNHEVKQVNIPKTPSSKFRSAVASSIFMSTSHSRERLGGYLHPRDMRRLVTPFSSSNEPQLIVRRHVMLLNFDPLRAIVLRDRLLVLVPDGADSILVALEKRVKGGFIEMENQVFGSEHDSVHPSTKGPRIGISTNTNNNGGGGQRLSKHNSNYTLMVSSQNLIGKQGADNDDSTSAPTEDNVCVHDEADEWEHLQAMDWRNISFELLSVDAILHTVIAMLMEDAQRVYNKTRYAMGDVRVDLPDETTGGGQAGGEVGDYTQSRLKLQKDEVRLIEKRVKGFVRAMNELLDEDEDMALMNLSRLITHPERFVQPVSQAVLHEESDEPELILEAYLQQASSIVNALDLLKGQIATTEEQISMTLDAVRNRLLYINTLLTIASLCVATGSFIGSIFGMNLTSFIEEDPTAFFRVTYGTLVGLGLMWIFMSWGFYKASHV